MKEKKKEEEEFVNKLISTFSKHFKVTTEVWSKCKTRRIDLVLKLQENVYFGIECKTPDKKRGEKIAEYLLQANDYSKLEFKVEENVFKKIPILICPPLSYNYFILNEHEKIIDNETWHKDRHDKFNTHHSVNGFCCAFDVGEVRKSFNNSYRFIFCNKELFSSRLQYQSDKIIGLHVKNYVNLLQKLR